MTVERLLQIHIATLTALGTLLLGMGQRNPILPVLAIFASVTSVIFTDSLRWFRLNRSLANIAALGAVLMSSIDFWTNASEQQLLAIANLLVYLQIILLYQPKIERRYWELALLSLLQVVVAAALNLGFEFGFLLVIYMLLAFSALSLFFLYREGLHHCEPDEVEPLAKAETATALAANTARKARSLRRRLLGDPPVVTPLLPPAKFTAALLGWRFTGQVASLGAMTLFFTVVLFFSVPRTSESAFQGAGGSMATVGFPQEVTFNERTEIRQSDEIVMRVTFRKPGSDQPLVIAGEPLFLGTVLSNYSTTSGRWSNIYGTDRRELPPSPTGVPLVYQDIVLNTAGEQLLFGISPTFAPREMSDKEREKFRFDRFSGQLSLRSRDVPSGGRPMTYTLATAGFRDTWQLPVTPHYAITYIHPDLTEEERQRRRLWWLSELEIEKERLTQIDREYFPQLIATADRILASANLEPGERAVAARLLQDHFRTPGAYNYTLDFRTVPRQRGTDPIEDFVANHRTGHCEYFASALCLMLRSQGIPARMVVGYKGGEYNSVGGYYWVRQLHAHAWVEAYLEQDQIPKGLLEGPLDTEAGGWLRLDPTPAQSGPLEISAGIDFLARIGDSMDYMQLLWDDYILGLNSERQRNSFYSPLTERATSALDNMIPSDAVRDKFAQLSEALGIDRATEGQWFSWRAGVVGAILAAAIVLLWQLGAWLWHWLRTRWRVDPLPEARVRRVVEFYQRLEHLLGQLGIRRLPAQTQREFASAASHQLAALGPQTAPVASLPGEIVEAFYRVRFGASTLDSQQTEAIEHALSRLAQAAEQSTAPASDVTTPTPSLPST
jgi:transglutaminase-like putative cysteine protease